MVSAYLLFLTVVLYTGSADARVVAFTAGQDTHLDLTNNETVPFTKIITNVDGSLSSGVFTCTSAGLYKFQVYALTKSDSSLFLELYHNDNLTASLWGHTINDYADSGNAVILYLTEGDTVQVKARAGYHVSTFGSSDQIYTTFTGIQLGGYGGGETPASAFSVALNTHQSVIGGSPVVYNSVMVDTNNAYDISSGTFIAPSAGIYVFHFFSLAQHDQELWQELYHNDDYVCSLYGKTTQDYADAGNTAIIHLKAGDRVQIRAHTARDNSLYGTTDQIYSTFSGYLMVPEWALISTEAEPTVYFSAGLTSQQTYQDGEKVIFDRVFTDHGSVGTTYHYNHLNGEFTAPYTGLYEFNFHALSQSDKPIWLELFLGYKYVDSLYSHVPSGYAAGGNAAVIEMDAGDVAYIRAHGANALYGTGGQVYCTFSGSLIQRASGSVDIVGK